MLFMSTLPSQFSRRHFIKASTVIGSGLLLPGCKVGEPRVASRKQISPNEKLNLGIIGAGGQGASNLGNFRNENVVALCDVDDNRAADSYKKFPNAQRYQDFRVMLEKEKSLDAVVVSTPDHVHAVAAITAMRLGKHVYCEKPLSHSIQEARLNSTCADPFTQPGSYQASCHCTGP